MTRQIRASLARDAASAAPQVPDDPQLRREVAAALLYQQPDHSTREAAPLLEEHPAATRSTGAPLTEEHPPSTTDAPLATGHPSAPNPYATRLRSQISEVTGLMGARLAEIEKDES